MIRLDGTPKKVKAKSSKHAYTITKQFLIYSFAKFMMNADPADLLVAMMSNYEHGRNLNNIKYESNRYCAVSKVSYMGVLSNSG